MTTMLSRAFRAATIDAEARTCDFVASTDAVDSYGEIVEQSWDLDRYKANPVVLFAHSSRDLPIGQCTRCEVVSTIGGPQLECTIRFLTEDKNPRAEQVWKMVRDSELRAVSVGFIPRSVRYEKRNGKDVYVLSDNELAEISVVPIPANPEALAKMKAKAFTDACGETIITAAGPASETTVETIQMDQKEFDAALAAKDAEINTLAAALAAKDAEVEQAAETARAERDALQSSVAEKEQALQTLTAENAKLRDAAIVRDVEALVGVKILPPQRDAYVRLAKESPDLYAKFIADAPDLNLTAPVIEPAATNNAPAAKSLGDLLHGSGDAEPATDGAASLGDLL